MSTYMPLPSDASTTTRWLAVSRRDPAANSSFLYGVKSTQIFCRPTCPGRVARRSNVIFFDNQHQAFDAGYRPCKRCQPCTLGWDKESMGRTLCNRARAIIVTAVENGTPWTVDGVAQELNITGAHLHRQFKRHFDITPRSFAASLTKAHITSDDSTVPHPDCQPDLLDLAQDCPHIQDVLLPNLPFSLDVGDGLDDVFFTPPNIRGHSEKECAERNQSEVWDFDIQPLLSIEDIVYNLEDE